MDVSFVAMRLLAGLTDKTLHHFLAGVATWTATVGSLLRFRSGVTMAV